MTSDWTQVKERGNYWAVLLAAWIYRYGGRWLVMPILYVVVFYFYISKASTRRCSKAYLARVEAYCNEEQKPKLSSWRHYMSFGSSLLDRVSAWMGQADISQVDFPDRYELLNTSKNDGGAIVLTAHFGNLEMARALVSDGKKLAINIVIDTQRTASFNRLLQQLDPDSKINLISTQSVGPATAIDVQQRLTRGESFVIMADRVSAGARKRTIDVELLGGEAQLPEGSFRLALSLGSPVFFMCCTKETNGRFRVHLKRLPTETLTGTKKQKTHALAQSYIRELESLCQDYPLQWFNFYDYWRDGPEAKQ